MRLRGFLPRVLRSRFELPVLGGAAALLSLLFVIAAGSAAPQQPIPFPHVAMVQAGVPCLFCHADAMRSPSAGMPSVDKCMGCHKVIATEAPAIKQLTAYWQRNEPIPWVRVYVLPRFVYFSHEVHIARGISCERCHGDVGHMKATVEAQRMNMGFCLNCHEQQPNASQLTDCVVCHQ